MRRFLSRFTLSLPVPVKYDLIVSGGVGAKREALPSAKRRDAPDATGRVTSFSVEGRGSRVLSQSSWRVCRCDVDTGGSSSQWTLTVDS